MNREYLNILHPLFLITLLYKVDVLAKPSSQIRVTAINVLIITLTVNQGNALSAELFDVLSLLRAQRSKNSAFSFRDPIQLL